MKKIGMGIIIVLLIVLSSYIVVAPVWYGSGDDTGLVGKWSCEGNFVDSSGQGNHGTQVGGVTITTGAKGRGCGFDGSDDMITVNDNDSLTSMNNLTISAWFKSDSLGSWRAIVGKGTSDANEEYTLMVSSTGVYFDVGGAGPYSSTTYTITSGNWHHIAAVHSRNATASTLKVYVDNVDIGATTTSPTLTPGNNSLNLSIGSRFYTGLSYFSGFIDELRVYNRALSATEISNLYNTSKTYHVRVKTTPVQGGMNDTPAPTLSDETGLVGYWKMDGNVLDSSGYGNNGVVNGATLTNAGRFKEGYEFARVNDGINVSDSASLALGNFSINLWFKPANSGTTTDIIAKSDATGFEYRVRWGGVYGLVPIIFINGWDNYRYCGASVPTGVWTMLSFTSNTSSAYCYINGGLNLGSPNNLPLAVTNSPALLTIGNSGWTGNVFNGSIDEVRIYNRSLSASEVMELYLSKGLVGYWKMDADQKNSTSTFDSSGYYNHGLISGATLTNEGKFKEGYKFDGVNDYISIAKMNASFLNNGTISAWIKSKPGHSTNARIVEYGSATNRVGLFLDGSHKISLYAVGNGGAVKCGPGAGITSVQTYNDDKWHHATGVYGSTGGYLYMDGTLVNSNTTDCGMTLDDTTRYIGEYVGGGAYYWNGSIDEVRVYNKALTASEVADLYNGTKSYHIEIKTTPTQGGMNDTPAPTSSNEAGLVGYWKLDGDATDSSGQGNNGVVTGANATNAGRWNGAYYFNGPGSSNMINMSNNRPSLNISTGNFSGFAWIKFVNNADAYQTIMGKLPVGGSGWMFMTYNVTVNNSLKLYYSVSDGTATSGFSTGSMADNSWHHVGFTTDRSSVSTFYIDGVSSGTLNTAARTGSFENTADFKIGLYAGYDPTGTIDEVRLYNRTLSADEVKELYLSKGLVGYWKMDADQRNSTSTFDSSGYYNHGLITGATLTNEGRFKEAYRLYGGTQKVTVPYSSAFNFTNGTNDLPFSVSAWIKIANAAGSSGGIIDAYTSTANAKFSLQLASGKLQFYEWDETTEGLIARTYNTAVPINTWLHVAGVYNGSKTNESNSIYVNGVKVDDTNAGSGNYVGMRGASGSLFIGNRGDNFAFNGTIDEVRVYNRALTDAEVAGLYNGTQTYHWRIKTVPG